MRGSPIVQAGNLAFRQHICLYQVAEYPTALVCYRPQFRALTDSLAAHCLPSSRGRLNRDPTPIRVRAIYVEAEAIGRRGILRGGQVTVRRMLLNEAYTGRTVYRRMKAE